MRLMHYTESPLVYDPDRTYVQNDVRIFGKPVGFWVSVEGEDDWPSWCTDNDFMVNSLAHPHEVALAPGHNVLLLPTVEDVRSFHTNFSVEDPLDGKIGPTRLTQEYIWKSRPIDWTRVAAQYDGLIIAPYQWPCRMKYDWYYGWDAASGCIWNLSAIASVSPVDRTVEAHS